MDVVFSPNVEQAEEQFANVDFLYVAPPGSMSQAEHGGMLIDRMMFCLAFWRDRDTERARAEFRQSVQDILDWTDGKLVP